MIAYVDTSILLKNYLAESGSSEARRLWREADGIYVSRVGYAEAVCAFQRKRHCNDLSDDLLARVLEAFRRDWYTLDHVEVSPELDATLDDISARYPLRGFDAIHLASALIVRGATNDVFVFASADRRLLHAAAGEGLQIFRRSSILSKQECWGATFNRSVAEVAGGERDVDAKHPQAPLHFVPLRLKVPPNRNQ